MLGLWSDSQETRTKKGYIQGFLGTGMFRMREREEEVNMKNNRRPFKRCSIVFVNLLLEMINRYDGE